MILLIDCCSFPWWLPWLLLPLLGLLAGWLLWGSAIGKLKEQIADLEAKLRACNAKVSGLEGDLNACHDRNATLNSDIALMKGKLSEVQASGSTTAQSIAASAATVVVPTPSASKPAGGRDIYGVIKDDDLEIVEGIGAKMSAVLKDNGVNTLSQLAAKTPEELRALLDRANAAKYRIIDPGTWSQQAKLAADGKWQELIALQKQLDTGRVTVGDGETDAKVEKFLIKMGALKRWKQDDLKAVEGIGPKIEELLHNAGITTWRQLSTTSVSAIQTILDNAGSRFSLADPGTWPKQAEMAADGRWDDLQEYQDFLQGGK